LQKGKTETKKFSQEDVMVTEVVRVKGWLKIFCSRNEAKQTLIEDFIKGKEHGRSLKKHKIT